MLFRSGSGRESGALQPATLPDKCRDLFSAAPGAQERAPLAEHKSRLLDGFVKQRDRLKAGHRTTISPEARWHYRGARSGPSNRGALATSLRAGPSRALDTFDKPRTIGCTDDVEALRRVEWAREGSVRAPTWTRDKPVKARGEPRQRRERPAHRAPAVTFDRGNRWAVGAPLVTSELAKTKLRCA